MILGLRTARMLSVGVGDLSQLALPGAALQSLCSLVADLVMRR